MLMVEELFQGKTLQKSIDLQHTLPGGWLKVLSLQDWPRGAKFRLVRLLESRNHYQCMLILMALSKKG